MRKYQEAWEKLKSSKQSPRSIIINAHPKLHPRIYKAVIKEKHMDLVYKMELAEARQRGVLWRLKDVKNIMQLKIVLCIEPSKLVVESDWNVTPPVSQA